MVGFNLPLKDASPHFNIYDRGSSLIAVVKDFFSQERTQKDAMQTARALAREVYNRKWKIEFAGIKRMEGALWVELEHLQDRHGKRLEVSHYTPTIQDQQNYIREAQAQPIQQQPGGK